MANPGEIVLTDVWDTEFGEKIVIDSEFEARNYIRFLPWKNYEDEIDEYGSLRNKAEQRADQFDESWTDEHEAAAKAIEAYDGSEGFPDDFSTHNQWDDENQVWLVDTAAFEKAKDFWEYVGFDVKVEDGVDTSKL